MLGMRIKFKGRVNRWRRTKSITAERGTIPLHTYDNRIEYGSAFAINRKGTLGIRIWFRYKPTFQYELKNSILKYMQYSKWTHLKKVKRGLLHFTKKK
jgi:ribosomal protein S3